MKNWLKIGKWTAVLSAIWMTSPTGAARAQSDSFVRVLHGLSLASKVDVYLDGKKTFNDLEFGGLTKYLRVPAGQHSFRVQSNNPSRTLLSVTRSFRAYDFQTLGIYGTVNRPRVLNANDSAGTPAYGRAQLTAYHLSPGLPAFDVVAYVPGGDILPLIRNVRYGQTRRANIPAFPMTIRIVRRGTTSILKTMTGADPRAGRKYALYAIGRPARNFKTLLDVTASQ
ncbi:protein of unknown function (DUF4397) [Abditibacterium utsteinense]|uniref:DUF4397 domain-containing protein n=1 Tax=Abditibacterium utsteinense TaxID=1960156 RepID=A0A2S8SV74_9BACT|nr:DUF4397 domain-containing protein [Abditibacterium utsteinense]PQV64691.1 protein of unknown function (DUF4397) [Abditibacterium utsteinense]